MNSIIFVNIKLFWICYWYWWIKNKKTTCLRVISLIRLWEVASALSDWLLKSRCMFYNHWSQWSVHSSAPFLEERYESRQHTMRNACLTLEEEVLLASIETVCSWWVEYVSSYSLKRVEPCINPILSRNSTHSKIMEIQFRKTNYSTRYAVYTCDRFAVSALPVQLF